MLLDLRFRLEFGLLLAITYILRAMPLEMAASVAAWVARVAGPRSRRHRRALKNLTKAMPEKTPQEREAIALGMWDNIGRVMAETLLMPRLMKQSWRIEFEDPALIERYRGKTGAMVIVGPHMGNWEIAMSAASAVGAQPAGVYRILVNPYSERFVRQLREPLYPGGMFASKGGDAFNTFMRIASHVRSGGALGMLADLVDWTGVQVPFFGHMIWATTAPAWLARRAGATLWAGRVIRVGKESRFKIALKELKVPRTDHPDEDVKVLTAAIQAQFEAWIREHPEQWLWTNKRWKDFEMPGGTQY